MTWETIPVGVWLIFGIVGLPVYAIFLGWFLGKPRNPKTSVLGVTVFLTLVSAVWIGLYLTTVMIGFIFDFGGLA